MYNCDLIWPRALVGTPDLHLQLPAWILQIKHVLSSSYDPCPICLFPHPVFSISVTQERNLGVILECFFSSAFTTSQAAIPVSSSSELVSRSSTYFLHLHHRVWSNYQHPSPCVMQQHHSNALSFFPWLLNDLFSASGQS